MCKFLCCMIKNKHLKVWSFVLKTYSSPSLCVVNDWHITRMKLFFILLLICFLHASILNCWRSSLDLHFTNWAFKLLTFIWTDKNTNSIKIVVISIVVWCQRWFWIYSPQIVNGKSISIHPVFSLELISCNFEIDSCDPSIFVWVRDYRF